jgi:glycine/D-amino acid oxidase-like deaminating enzyme
MTWDLCIVGAGIIGASAAWQARQRHPDWQILLLEQNLAGTGASWYAANLDLPYGHTPLRRKLTQDSRTLFQAMSRLVPSISRVEMPFVAVTATDQVADLMPQLVLDEFFPASDKEREKMEAFLKIVRFKSTDTVLNGGVAYRSVNGMTAPLLLQYLQRSGGISLRESHKVLNISRQDGHLRVDTEGEGSFEARRLIVATGPWMGSTPGAEAALASGLRVKKIVSFHLEAEALPGSPTVYFFDREMFLMPRQEAAGWLMSYRCDEWDVLPHPDSLKIRPEDRETAAALLAAVHPDLPGAMRGGRVFCDAYLPDGNPLIVRPDPGVPLVLAGAGGGSGYRLGPGIGQMAVEMVEKGGAE